METNKAIRIMIVDDHPLMRQGLAALIGTQPDMAVVAEAEDGRQAIKLFKQHTPDVTFMDLRMPGMSGVDAINVIRQEYPEARIIVLTTYDGDEDIYRALRAGAMSYLLKEMRDRDVLDAIRSVHAGRRNIPPHIATRVGERTPLSDLTSREHEVLTLIVEGMNNKEIAGALSITVDGVKFHIKNILSKLTVSDRAQAVTAAIRRGIIHLD